VSPPDDWRAQLHEELALARRYLAAVFDQYYGKTGTVSTRIATTLEYYT
jgi:hypothetical protein